MKKKKVLIVNNRLGYYGAENVLINMVNHMDQNKYDITVLTFLESDSSKLNPSIHYRYLFSKKSGFFQKIKNKLKLLAGYAFLAKKYCSGYDIAIAFKMGESSQIVGYCDSPHKYCWIHDNVTEIKDTYSYSFNSLEEEKNFLKRFNSMIAVSNGCADSFKTKYGNDFKIRVIYNPIDFERINVLSNEELSEDEKQLFCDNIPIIGTVARIDYQKGIDRLIYIAEELSNHNIEYKMVVIGDGVDYKKYFDIIQSKQLPIHMLGFKSNPYKYMKKFNLFVCSSVSESYSLVVNEALALQIPVISTKCGGPEEVLQYGRYGTLTENNQESLFAAIFQFLQNELIKTEKYNGKDSMDKFLINIDELMEMD